MKCFKCKKSAIEEVEYAGNHYCERHFLELMEKRVRKHIRVLGKIDEKKEYCLLDDGSSEFQLTKYFLERIYSGRLKLKIVKTCKKNASELIVPTNLDEQALIFLDEFLKNKKKTEKRIMPLEVLLQKEVELLCGILAIKFKPRVKRNILDDLEKRHPGTMFSLFKSRQNLG
jgi:hypothetical protein